LRSIERDDAVLKATVIELKSSTTGNEPVWRGVGKMFLSTPVDDYVGELEQQQKENKDRKSAIEKKKDYFEVSVQKVEDSLKQIIGNKN
jgi:prefoldin subunit 1